MLLRTRSGRRAATAAGVLALTTTLAATAGPALAAPPDRAAAGKPGVVSLFPTDALTVADPGQITGRRVALPVAGCGAAITCGLVQQLNQLDGFDLDPRLAVRFAGAVDPTAAARRITLQGEDGHRTGVDRVVWDPATSTLYAHPAEQLAPSTTYRLRVQGGPANKAASTVFTTMSATDGLLDLREQIEDGSAFAGIAQRGLQVDGVFSAATTRVVYQSDRGPGDLVPETLVTPLAGTGARYVFGSYLAPSWLRGDVTIEQTPTKDDGPSPTGAVRLPFVAVLPAGPAPSGGFPVSVYGHGFTRSAADVFLASVANAQAGLATIATDVVGHGYGPRSTWQITSGTTVTTLAAYARGVDQDDPGAQIGSTEGSSATGAATAVGSRDALRQTAADIMTLVRAVGGTDVDTDGRADLSGTAVTYFGQSFGGIYGTMLTGADPDVARSVLNVPGGPVTEIARLGAFRPLTTLTLQAAGLLNSTDPSRNFFQEQLPLKGDAPLTATVPGAVAIQDYLAKVTWVTRSGSPETFAPLIRDRRVIIQVAYGDETVPNPTSYTIADAGDLFHRVSLYRNDKATPELANPHGFLLQLDHPSALQGQRQVATFLRTGQTIDPDGAGPVWEVPIADPSVLLELNFPFPALRP